MEIVLVLKRMTETKRENTETLVCSLLHIFIYNMIINFHWLRHVMICTWNLRMHKSSNMSGDTRLLLMKSLYDPHFKLETRSVLLTFGVENFLSSPSPWWYPSCACVSRNVVLSSGSVHNDLPLLYFQIHIDRYSAECKVNR